MAKASSESDRAAGDGTEFVVRLKPTDEGWTASISWPTGGAHFTAAADYETTVEKVHVLLMETAASTVDLAEDYAHRMRMRLRAAGETP